jgi:hypothetical protein
MDANESTPGPGESPSTAQTVDWELLGRVLLVEALQYRGDALREVWMALSRKARKGEPVTRADWVRLSEELTQFSHVVEELEKATRGTETKTAARESEGEK